MILTIRTRSGATKVLEWGRRQFRQIVSTLMARKNLDTHAIALAKLRVDGFVSLKGGIEWGWVLTKPLVVEGDQLHVNVDSWRGRVTAAILDAENGQPLAGFSGEESIAIVADEIDETFRWKQKSDVHELRGKTVRIRFSLLRAEIYAFWFTNNAYGR